MQDEIVSDVRALRRTVLPKWRQDRWNEGFAALSKFRAREGHCRPSRHHVEGDFKLGPWVTTQRYNKDNLSAERKRRLNAIGFVWNWRDYLWDRGFMALLKFKRREGHCHVSILHREGNYKLGYWVSTQRRKRKELSAERVRSRSSYLICQDVITCLADTASPRPKSPIQSECRAGT